MIAAPLGVTNDDMTATKVRQHGCGNITRVGSGILCMAILATQGDSRILESTSHCAD